MGISRWHYVGLDRLLDILGTLHHLPQLLQQLCCNFWTHLPTCNWNKAQNFRASPAILGHSHTQAGGCHHWKLPLRATVPTSSLSAQNFSCLVTSLAFLENEGSGWGQRVKADLSCKRPFPPGKGLAYPVVIHRSLTHLPTLLACVRNQSTPDIPYDSQERSWHVMLTVQSTHRSEAAPPVMCTERNFQSFYSGGRDTVPYMPQEHRLLGEQAMHLRNSEMDQLRMQFLEGSL